MIDLDKAAAELVADWPPISQQSMARIAGLVRPTVVELMGANPPKKAARPRIPAQRRAA